MNIYEVARGCLEGKIYRHPDLMKELEIKLGKIEDYNSDKRYLVLYLKTSSTDQGDPFPVRAEDAAREDYYEVCYEN